MEPRYFVLLVEDEPLIQFLIVDILEGIGVPVSGIAASVSEALDLIERGGFDGAILDCVLNDGRCEPVAEALHEKGIPFIIVSGHSEQEVGSRFPGVRYVAKPFRAGDLEQAVASMTPATDGGSEGANDNLECGISQSGQLRPQ